MTIKGKTDKKLINITNVLDDNTIQLYGLIGQREDIDWAPFQECFRQMDYAGNTITILENCYGGDVFSGLAIFDLVKAAKAKVIVVNEGIAASMGAVLLQAATPGMRKATKNSRVMIHRVSGRCNGDADEHTDYAAQLVTEENNIIDLFVGATAQDKKTVKGWMVRGVDKWFTAQQALEAGLIDEIIEPSAQQNLIPANKLKGKTAEEIWQLYNSHTQTPQNTDMNKFKMAILAVLAKAAITAVPNETDSDEKWVEALNNATAALEAKATAAQNSLKQMNADRAKELIENAVSTGKLPKDLAKEAKEKLIEDATSNYGIVSNALTMIPELKVEEGSEETPKGEKFDINNALGKTEKTIAGKIKFPQGRETWNLDKWATEDNAGLEELERSNASLYNKLIDDKKAELKRAGTIA